MMRRLIVPLLLGLSGTIVLLWLGIWQLQRLEWKEGVLAEIDARIGGTPVPLPGIVDPATDRFLPVVTSGSTGDTEILVQSSLKLVGPGFRVIAPFQTDDGRPIMVDRGFIRLTDRDRVRPSTAMTVTGNLHWPDEQDIFTPDPDIPAGLWFARDVAGMAAALGTEPVLVVARTTDEAVRVVTPLPVDSAGIPNDHLQYAVTWFLLAVVWAAMTVYLAVTLCRRQA